MGNLLYQLEKQYLVRLNALEDFKPYLEEAKANPDFTVFINPDHDAMRKLSDRMDSVFEYLISRRKNTIRETVKKERILVIITKKYEAELIPMLEGIFTKGASAGVMFVFAGPEVVISKKIEETINELKRKAFYA